MNLAGKKFSSTRNHEEPRFQHESYDLISMLLMKEQIMKRYSHEGSEEKHMASDFLGIYFGIDVIYQQV